MVHLAGESNFRDAAIDGCLAPGLVFRSGELSALSPEEVEALAGLRHVVDLRTERERREAPDRLPPGVEVISVPIDPTDGRWTLVQLALRRLDFDTFMHGHYERTVFRHGPCIGEAFRVLARAEGPVLVHCTAGKDRTGVVIALLQGLLGAAQQQVLACYLETNGRIDARADALAARLRWMGGWPYSARELQPLMEARPSYLVGALAKVMERHGSERAYLEAVCGVDAECVADLVERYRPRVG